MSSSDYPDDIDVFAPLTDGIDVASAADQNKRAACIVAIENTLGITPQGTFPTVGAGLAAKLTKSGDSMSGILDMGLNRITNLEEPENDQDAANKIWVEDQVSPEGMRWRDDFLGARSSRWTLGGTGGTYTQNAELGGTGSLATGATSSNQAVLSFAGKGCVDKTTEPYLVTRAKLGHTTEIRAVLAGLYKDDNNLVEVYYDVTSSAGNFKYRCVSGGTETSVDSGVAADTDFHMFEIEVEGDDVEFFIDGENQETISTNVPTALLEPRFLVETKESADKVLTVDVLHLEAGR